MSDEPEVVEEDDDTYGDHDPDDAVDAEADAEG